MHFEIDILYFTFLWTNVQYQVKRNANKVIHLPRNKKKKSDINDTSSFIVKQFI